jgi:hypothetical protein
MLIIIFILLFIFMRTKKKVKKEWNVKS